MECMFGVCTNWNAKPGGWIFPTVSVIFEQMNSMAVHLKTK